MAKPIPELFEMDNALAVAQPADPRRQPLERDVILTPRMGSDTWESRRPVSTLCARDIVAVAGGSSRP